MPLDEQDARKAARLVALGFPGDRALYAEERPELLERWRGSPEFRRLAEAIARGLGLVLIEVTTDGDVVLAAEPGTPFTPTQETLLPSSTERDARRRQLAVAALLAVVAEVFPTEDALAEVDPSREVRPADVVQLLVSRAEAVAREPEPVADGPGSARALELQRAFAVVRQVQPSVPTETGREGSAGLQGIVTSVLRDLAVKGLLREAAGDSGPVFRPAAAFAAHVRYLLDREFLDDAIQGLRAARAAGTALRGQPLARRGAT